MSGKELRKRTVAIVGAGQLGSRHLQALRAVRTPLSIVVVDPVPESLRTAQERYASVPASGGAHEIQFLPFFPVGRAGVELGIVATTSRHRWSAIQSLLAGGTRYLLLEKLLFQKREDYQAAGDAFERLSVKAWVNCSMRTMPFYRAMREQVGTGPIRYDVVGSSYGLVTNAIHYIDHMSFLTRSRSFEVDTSGLDATPLLCKRPGFLELGGTLRVRFKEGSVGSFTDFRTGTAPLVVSVASAQYHCVYAEARGLVRVSRAVEGWDWKDVEATVPFQSQMTTAIVEEILENGRCALTPYNEAAQDHVALHRALSSFLKENKVSVPEEFPFT